MPTKRKNCTAVYHGGVCVFVGFLVFAHEKPAFSRTCTVEAVLVDTVGRSLRICVLHRVSESKLWVVLQGVWCSLP